MSGGLFVGFSTWNGVDSQGPEQEANKWNFSKNFVSDFNSKKIHSEVYTSKVKHINLLVYSSRKHRLFCSLKYPFDSIVGLNFILNSLKCSFFDAVNLGDIDLITYLALN